MNRRGKDWLLVRGFKLQKILTGVSQVQFTDEFVIIASRSSTEATEIEEWGNYLIFSPRLLIWSEQISNLD